MLTSLGTAIPAFAQDRPELNVGPRSLSSGEVGSPYSQSFYASDGSAPYRFTLFGDVPPGLSFEGDTLSGTPTQEGSYEFRIYASDSSTPGSIGGSRNYTLTIRPQQTASCPTSWDWTLARPGYGSDNGETGDNGSVSWPVESTGTLAQANFSNLETEIIASVVSSNPSAVETGVGATNGYASLKTPGSATLTASFKDPSCDPISLSVTVAVTEAPTANATTTTVDANSTANAVPLDIDSSVANGSDVTTVAVASSPSNGTAAVSGMNISYTPAAGFSGTDSFTYTATNAAGTSSPATATITVEAIDPVLQDLSFEAEANTSLIISVASDGLSASYRLVTAPTHGTIFINADGSGTYTPNAGFSGTDTFVYDTGADGNTGTVTITIAPPNITIDQGSFEDGVVYADYSGALAANGGIGPYIFTVTTGNLPDGLTLASDGTLSGVPTEAGIFSFTVTARDENDFSGSQDYSLNIAPPEITLGPNSLPAGTGGTSYGPVTLTAAGGMDAYEFTMPDSLPDGILLAPDGTLSGSPAEDGSFTFTVTATDENGFSGTRDFTLAVNAPEITLDPDSLPDAVAGEPYEALTFTAVGGNAPYDITLDGTLPQGMSLEGSKLSGTPSEAGNFQFNVIAEDRDGFTGQRSYTLNVSAPGITLTPEALPEGAFYSDYAVAFTADGGVAPYNFELTGKLPEGLGFEDGRLSGRPVEAGAFSFTVLAMDESGFAGEREYTLIVAAPDLALAPEALPGGRVNSAYSASLQAEGGTAPYGFTVTKGDLPNGLRLAEDGTLSGTPLDPGSFEVTITATDRYGFTGSRDYVIAIEDITLPRPRNHELTVMAGTNGRIDLTRGASGGPFTDAAIVANPADEAGIARITREGGSHILHFSASGIYAGTTSLSYTLSNADGFSEPASVMITVVARPDPSLDPEVIGLVRAQTETAKRFAKAQIRNFSQRLEQLHDEGTRRRNSIVLNLVAQSAPHDSDSMSLRGPERFGNQSNDLAFWSGGYVNFGSSGNDGIDLDHTLVGISAGADYRFTPKFTAGLGLGYGRDVTDIGENGTESRAKALSMAAYGSYRPKPGFFIDGLAGYSSLDFDSKRYVTSTGDMATGTRGGEQIFAALTAGFEHREDGLLISPYGRLSASRSTLDMFSEEGGGVYNLTYDEQVIETLSGTLGLRFEHSRPMDWGSLTSRARLEYTHDFEGSSEARIGYADLGTFPYAIDVEGYSRDELAIGLGLDAQIGDLWTLGLDYRTAFGTDGDSRDQTVAVKLDVRF